MTGAPPGRGIVALLGVLACASPPTVTYHLDAPTFAETDLHRGLAGWESVGLVRVPLDVPAAIATVRMEYGAPPGGAEGSTNPLERRITIREGLAGFRLWVTVAHEVGHAVLDTGRHTTCGIMGGVDVQPCDQDIGLMCERIGLCPY